MLDAWKTPSILSMT